MTPRTVLVLGATGMLGHRVCRAGTAAGDIDLWATVRGAVPASGPLVEAIVDPTRLIGELDAATDADQVGRRLDAVLAAARPDAVINCIGLVKQRPTGEDTALTDAVNARFPHLVAERTIAAGIGLVHLSTDCVFDGHAGGYRESDPVTATDAYGRSKAAGEPLGEGVTVVRTSMIGRELHDTTGLLEWFLAAPPPIPGFSRARFSGLTTALLADVLLDLVRRSEPLTGLFHVAADPIDKASLLGLLVPHYRPGVEVIAVDGPVVDRTLDGRRFATATGFVAPPWPAMISALAADPFPYDRWRTEWPR